ncbi:MAG: nucleotidyltransferase domain-containing protein [bacterium]|jgi:predicted nucleotidyltransferase
MHSVDKFHLAAVWPKYLNIVAAWVFGSAKQGVVRPGSDLDIAVLFTQKPTLEERVVLLTDLQQAAALEKVDLLILNDASPIARMEALSGPLLFCRDDGVRAIFTSLAAREYESEMAFLAWGLAMRAEIQAVRAATEVVSKG